MRRINQLDQTIASQIAAGEVIERPASVVKELLENSIDSGADSIIIDIQDGGISKIKVTDNGLGIHPDDLVLSISPHATSKITSVNDLAAIDSLGFRGEALASIASVSNINIVSKLSDSNEARRLSATGGAIDKVLVDKGDVGTMIEVSDLFFNVPVRKKFLKSKKTENIHVDNTIKRSILSNFDIRYQVKYQGKPIYQFSPANNIEQKEKRIEKLLGKQFIENAVHIELETNDLSLKGWICLPSLERRQSDWQFFYLNGRIIRDRLVQHAIRQAYGDLLDSNFQPAYALYLEMSPTYVDINVHPTKHEVRFQDSRYIHDFIVSAIRKALAGDLKQKLHLSRELFENNYATTEFAPGKGYAVVKEKEQPLGDFIDVIHEKFIINKSSNGISLFDVKELYLQVRYLELSSLKEEDYKSVAIPKTLVFKEKIFNLIQDNQNLLMSYGLKLDILGENTFVLRKAHVCYQGYDFKQLLDDVFTGMEDKDYTEDFIKQQLVLAMANQFKYQHEKHNPKELLATLAKQGCHHTSFRGQTIWREVTLAKLSELL